LKKKYKTQNNQHGISLAYIQLASWVMNSLSNTTLSLIRNHKQIVSKKANRIYTQL